VRIVNQVVALLLLALWMPATLHCTIDAVMHSDRTNCESSCNHESGDSEGEICGSVESGSFISQLERLIISEPNLAIVECLACLHARLLFAVAPLPPPAWTKDDPSGWVPQWAFAARAAMPARAPNLT
jgi:hypothetical protein